MTFGNIKLCLLLDDVVRLASLLTLGMLSLFQNAHPPPWLPCWRHAKLPLPDVEG